jgi:hypothetical protein
MRGRRQKKNNQLLQILYTFLRKLSLISKNPTLEGQPKTQNPQLETHAHERRNQPTAPQPETQNTKL